MTRRFFILIKKKRKKIINYFKNKESDEKSGKASNALLTIPVKNKSYFLYKKYNINQKKIEMINNGCLVLLAHLNS